MTISSVVSPDFCSLSPYNKLLSLNINRVALFHFGFQFQRFISNVKCLRSDIIYTDIKNNNINTQNIYFTIWKFYLSYYRIIEPQEVNDRSKEFTEFTEASYFIFTITHYHYLRWRIPPFMRQCCWGLPRRLAQCTRPQGWGKYAVCCYALIN